MNRKLSVLSALVAGLVSMGAIAQVSPQPPAAAPQPAAVAPQAIPAKIALIAFEQAVFATNEGQRAALEVQKKYEPKKAQIEAQGAEVDSLKKQLQAAPATMPDAERAERVRSIDEKEKRLNLDAESATQAYNADLQTAYGGVAAKVNVVLKDYVAKNGYTILLDVGTQQSTVMWALPNTEITEAVVNAYNASSGVAAPPPAAPSASRPKPAATTPRSTTPKAATPPK
jgi:Skp family chaperone for outer membrane proteins